MKKFFSKYWMIFTIIAMLVIIVLQNACKKPELESISMSGIISNKLTSTPLEGILLELYSQSIKDGIYTTGYEKVAFAETNTLGEYSFSFETTKAISYRLKLIHPDYFEESIDLEPELLNTGEDFKYDEVITPIARVQVEVHNTTPFDQFDQISYNIVRGYSNCSGCCTTTGHQVAAPIYHDTLRCITEAEQYLVVQWHSEKNGVSGNHIDSVYCPSFVTTNFIINF